MIPLHVVAPPSRWSAAMEAKGLAVVEPTVAPDDVDLCRMVLAGNLGALAGWRVATAIRPVDRCVLTEREQVARLLGYLGVLRRLLASGDGVWAIGTGDASPDEAAVRAFAGLAAALDRADPAWDVLCLASKDNTAHADATSAVDADRVRVARLRFMTAGTACHLVSARGAAKLVPLLDHADTHADMVVGLGAHMGVLRVYGAETGSREPFVPLDPAVPLPPLAPATGQTGGLPVLFGPRSYVPAWTIALSAVGVVAVVAIGVALAVICSKRPRQTNRQ